MTHRTCLLITMMMGLSALPLGACGDDDDDDDSGEGEGECAQDATDSFDNAIPLPDPAGPGEPNVEGFICPVGDRDFYRVTVPDNSLMHVNMVLAAGVSRVDLQYNLYATDGNNLVVPGSTVAAGVPLSEASCPAAGDYILVIQDQADDDFDARNGYQLTVTMEPDPDTSESDAPIPLALGGNSTGYISCLGDTDRFDLNVPADQLLEVHLTSDVATYEPAYRILKEDGTLLYQNMNESGSVQTTDISGVYAVPVAGHYFLEVFDWKVDDDDDRFSDPDTPYTINLIGHNEPDPNDRGTRNDVADTATSLGNFSCGGAYAGQTVNGYLSAIGDVDWYRIPLSGCTNGIIQVTMDTAGTDGIDPQIRLVRRYTSKSCDRDEDCVDLGISCDCDIHCAGWGNTCVGVVDVARPDDDNRCRPNDDNPNYQPGTCSGAATCIGGVCGATQFEKNEQAGTHVATAQPLLDSDVVYLVVQDFRADASDIDTPYSLRIETRADPDGFERDSVYNPYPFRYVNRRMNFDLAREAGSAEAGFCVTGHLATEHDEDWYHYTSACPDQQEGVDACTINVHSTFSQGPVDFIVTVVRGGNDWFQPAVISESANNSATTEDYGPPNECFFAVEGDSGYYIVINDNRGTRNNPNTFDWSDTQTYQVCFDPYVVGCNAPCQWIAEGGGGCNL